MILSWAISFSLFALIAAALGLSHAAATTGLVAKICFALFGLVSLVRIRLGGDGRAHGVPDVAVPTTRVGIGESVGRSIREESRPGWLRARAGLVSLRSRP
jgi:uncharacterized membrane protein YtjA (UPF0391 family)